MASPGGFPFCFVAASESRRPAAAAWTGHDSATHLSLVDQVALDIPAEHGPAEVHLWSRLTGWPAPDPLPASAFAPLYRPPGQPLRLLPHRLDEPTGPVRGHLDLACTARAAEIARHVTLGAQLVGEGPEWTVLLAPDGRHYWITDRRP
jgi:hypothetical protein